MAFYWDFTWINYYIKYMLRKLLKQWVDTINAAGFIIEAAYGIEDTFLIGIGKNDKADKLFLDREKALADFKELMPELLKTRIEEEGMEFNGGSIKFNPADSSAESQVVGYTLFLKGIKSFD